MPNPTTAHPIFISYASTDGEPPARRLHTDLHSLAPTFFAPESIPLGASWDDAVQDALKACTVLLAVITPGYRLSKARKEFVWALNAGKHIIPLVTYADPDLGWLAADLNYLDITDYPAALPRLRAELPPLLAAATPQAPAHCNVPALPQNFVARPDELAPLRELVLDRNSNPNIAVTALAGMGGIGKTVLAQALCHEPAVQAAFPDGIFWLTVGQEPGHLDPLQQTVARALDAPDYHNALAGRRALVVLDDVWNAAHVEPFRTNAPGCCLLFTTRNQQIANNLGAASHRAGLLSPGQARRLLAERSRRDPMPPEADAILQHCAGLPLAIAMLGARLAGKPDRMWTLLLDRLHAAGLDEIKADLPDYSAKLLRETIAISVEALDPAQQPRYLDLAIFPPDTAIHVRWLQMIWRLDEFDALDSAESLLAASLLSREADSSAYRLHDLQHDYLARKYSDQDSLRLIHSAFHLSAHVVTRDPEQLASQLFGRLMVYRDRDEIAQLLQSVEAARPRPALTPPGGPLLRTLSGHSSAVSAVSVTPDGRRAVSASSDRTLKVWDLASGEDVRTLSGHSSSVTAVALTSDGRRAVSASYDRMLKLWDLETGEEVRTLPGHASGVTAVSVTPDGRRAVSASDDQTLKVWDLESGAEVRTLSGHSGGVNAVAVTPDGRRAVSASSDQTLKLWDLDSGAELRTLSGHSHRVNAVAVTPDGHRAVSASFDQTLKLWDLKTGEQVRTLAGHSEGVSAVALTPDGRRAVSASSDQTLKLWDLETGEVVHTLAGHSTSVSAVALAPDGHRAVSASFDQTLKLWNLETGEEIRTLAGHSHGITAVAMTPDGHRAVSASLDQTLKLWDLETGEQVRTLSGHSARVNAVAMTPDGRCAVSASFDQTLKLWDLETGEEVRTLAGHSGWVSAVRVHPDGHRAVSASFDQTLKLWDLETGEEVRTLTGHSAEVIAVAVPPDGHRAVSASLDQTLKLWDLETGEDVRTLAGHSNWVWAVAVAPDGCRAVSASEDQTLKLWDLESGACLATYTTEAPALCCVAAPDGSTIIAGDQVGRLYFLEIIDAR